MQLTKNFHLIEFLRSSTAARLSIDNTPTPAAQVNLHRLAKYLQGFRDFVGFPIRITSGYRSPRLNSAVGGVPTSDHMKGLAADFYVIGLSPHQSWQKFMEYRNHCRVEGIYDPVYQAMKYASSGHIHVGIRVR